MFRHKKRLSLLLLSFAVLVAACGLFLLPRPDARITPANCDKIRQGMTEREVEAILGGPAGFYTGWPHPVVIFGRGFPIPWMDKYWFGEDGMIAVNFDPAEGKASRAHFYQRTVYKSRRGRLMAWLQGRLRR
jgi:hypothetical protein